MKRIILITLLISQLTLITPSWLSAKTRFTNLYIDQHKFLAEVMSSPEQIEKGMMFRETMSKNFAMLFIFKEEAPRGFWMKNCHVHLDIIYLNRDKEIINIHHNVPPCKADPCRSYYSDKPAQYVVEIKGTLSKKLGLKPGDSFDFIL